MTEPTRLQLITQLTDTVNCLSLIKRQNKEITEDDRSYLDYAIQVINAFRMNELDEEEKSKGIDRRLN